MSIFVWFCMPPILIGFMWILVLKVSSFHTAFINDYNKMNIFYHQFIEENIFRNYVNENLFRSEIHLCG